MRTCLALIALAALAACGADGEPERPVANATVTLSDSGVQLGTNVGLRRGPVTVGLGLGF